MLHDPKKHLKLIVFPIKRLLSLWGKTVLGKS